VNWWRRLRKAREAERESGAAAPRLRRPVLSWATLGYVAPPILLAGLHLSLFPPTRTVQGFALEAGSITDHEIIAPLTFTSRRPLAEVEAARREAEQHVVPVYRVIASAEARTEQRLREIMRELAESASSDSALVALRATRLADRYRSVPRESWLAALAVADPVALQSEIEKVVRANLATGVVDMTPRGTYQTIEISPPDGGAIYRDFGSIVVGYRLGETLLAQFGAVFEDRPLAKAAGEIAQSVLLPNLGYDDEETERRRLAAAADVPTFREYARNERILDAGVRVSRDDLVVLAALNAALNARELAQDATISLRLYAGRVLLLAALLVGFLLLLQESDRRKVTQPNHWFLTHLLLALYLAASAVLFRNPQWGGPYAVPVVMLGMLATILFGERAGTRLVILGIMLLAILPNLSGGALVCWAVGGGAACRMVRRVRHRNRFYKALLVVALALLATTVAIGLGEGLGLREHAVMVLRVLGSAVVSTALTLFLLPIFEALFGVTTELTLLELGDLNHPLLRRMSLESPGTYHHSQVVGTLAEAATQAVGANSLAARVGANFHDIGKMLKPRYYVENQYGENPHDELSPSMSALVIAAHVRDGVELGRQWGLPREVLAYIPEHHGTSVMQYFYKKALERDDGRTVNVDDFRYPGPRPQSRETAIVMLADGVEASTRSLRRMTPSRIREMVRKIIERRLADGELDECGLSLSDLAKIREAFVPILVGIHHERVAYPGQREHEERKERESGEARARNRRGGSTLATGG
jgi:putative nucleotidyltransferase with HDIG domain